MIERAVARSAPESPRKRFVGTVLTYTLLGPFLGGVIPYLALMASLVSPAGESAWRPSIMDQVVTGLLASLIALPFAVGYSLALGIIPAFLTGLIIAIWNQNNDRSGALFPAVTGGVIGLLTTAALWRLLGWPLFSGSPQALFAISILLGSIFAAVVCWRIVRPGPQVAR